MEIKRKNPDDNKSDVEFWINGEFQASWSGDKVPDLDAMPFWLVRQMLLTAVEYGEAKRAAAIKKLLS